MSVLMKVKYLNDSKVLYGEGLTYGSLQAVGMDLRAAFAESEYTLLPSQRVAVPTGIAIELSENDLAGFVYSRSGLGAKHGLSVAQGVGVIDPDYRGEIVVYLYNSSAQAYTIQKGERIAQLVIQEIIRPVLIESQELSSSQRGAGGFGHTGK